MNKKTVKKNFPLKKHITLVNAILALAASFAAYNFGLAGGYIEGTRFSAGGFMAGLVVNGSLVLGASKYGSVRGKNRTKQATISLIALLVLSPVMVSPVIYNSLPDAFLVISHEPLAAPFGSLILDILCGLPRVLWAVGWPLAADVAIVVAGSVAGNGLVRLEATHSEGTTDAVPTSANAPEGTTDAVRLNADVLRKQCDAIATQYKCTAPLCDWSPTVDALMEAAQKGKDPKRSAASAKAGHTKNQHAKIPVDKSLLVNQERE